MSPRFSQIPSTVIISISILFALSQVSQGSIYTTTAVGLLANDTSAGYDVSIVDSTVVYTLDLQDAWNATYLGEGRTWTAGAYFDSNWTQETLVNITYPVISQNPAIQLNSTGLPSQPDRSTTFGIKTNELSVNVNGGLNVTILQPDTVQSYGSALWISGSSSTQFNVYGPLNVNMVTRYGHTGIFVSSLASAYFHGPVSHRTEARGTLWSVYTEVRGKVVFYRDVNLWAIAKWSGDDVNVVYINNVSSQGIFYGNLDIHSESYSSTNMGIRSQGNLRVYGYLNITLWGPRTVHGLALSHSSSKAWIYGDIIIWVRGGFNTFGDGLAIRNDWGGQLYMYGSVKLYAECTDHEKCFGVSNTGIYRLMSEDCTYESITNASKISPIAYGIYTTSSVTTYTTDVQTYAWNFQAYAISVWSSPVVSLNCLSSDPYSHRVKLVGHTLSNSNTSQICAFFATEDSYHIGNHFFLSSSSNAFLNFSFVSPGATWYYNNPIESGYENHTLYLNNGVLFFTNGAVVDLSKYPSQDSISNLTSFPVHQLSIVKATSTSNSAVELSSAILRVRCDASGISGASKCDSLDLSGHSGASISDLSISVTYDLAMNNTESFMSQLNANADYSISFSSPFPVLRGYTSVSASSGTWLYDNGVFSAYITPELVVSNDVVYISSIRFSKSLSNETIIPHSRSKTGAIVGGVLGGLVGVAAIILLAVLIIKRKSK